MLKQARYKEDEYALQYKQAKTKAEKDELFKKIIKELDPIIHDAINNIVRTKSMDPDIIYWEAVGIIYDTIDDWNPKLSKFSTYVRNQLMRLYRYAYKYGQPLKLSEEKLQQFNKYQAAITAYIDEHGHMNYTPEEIAKISGLPLKTVKDLMTYDRNIFNTSTESTTQIEYGISTYKLDFDILDNEFKHTLDKDGYKVWKEIQKDLKKDNTMNISALDISKRLNMPYRKVKSTFDEVTNRLNNILAYL